MAVGIFLVLHSSIGFGDNSAARITDSWGPPLVVLTSASFGITNLVFALYTGGRVLSVAPGNDYLHYRLATLTEPERRALLAGLPLERVGRLHPPHRDGVDGSTECIHVWSRGRERHDCLWGLMWDADGIATQPAPPLDMLAIWKRLAQRDWPSAQAWTPEQLHIVATRTRGDDACSRQAPSPWPPRWPHPPAQTAHFRFRSSARDLPTMAASPSDHRCPLLVGDATDRRLLFFANAYPHDELWLPAGD